LNISKTEICSFIPQLYRVYLQRYCFYFSGSFSRQKGSCDTYYPFDFRFTNFGVRFAGMMTLEMSTIRVCRSFLLITFLSLFYFCSYGVPNPPLDILTKRELRGVWIATVVNIDWPSASNLTTAQQQAELIQQLDNHQRAGINAILLQIRPSADAFYAKSKEPWSRFLTGKPGQQPAPFYDPLAFAIEEAHKRGMELHAWINPYRATFDLVAANTTADHITRQKPQWFFIYGGKKLFNPGLPEVREYITGIV